MISLGNMSIEVLVSPEYQWGYRDGSEDRPAALHTPAYRDGWDDGEADRLEESFTIQVS